MALDSYANLKTAIGTWTGRADSSDFADDCIDLFEAWANRNLRVRQMQEEATASSAERLELPSDFLEMRNLQFDGSTRRELSYVTPEYADTYDSTGTAGTPRFYTVINDEIRIVPSPSESGTVRMSYYESIPALSGSQTTNWLLTAYPDCYLYGCLMHASAYVQDDGRVEAIKAAFSQIVSEIQRTGRRSEYGGSLAIRAA